jgi:hypothetical protein
MSQTTPFRRVTLVSRFVPAGERVFLRPTCVSPRPGIVAKRITVYSERKHRSLTSDSGKRPTDVSCASIIRCSRPAFVGSGRFVELN